MKHLREVKDTPNSIINDDGTYNIGVFNTYFKDLNFRDNPRPFLRRFFNNQLLTEWQAIEISGKDIFMIVAVFKFNIVNKSLFLVYDKVNDKLYDFSSDSKFKNKSKIAKSLENLDTSFRTTANSSIEISNELNHKRIYAKGHYELGNYNARFDIELQVISDPSNVVIPLKEDNIIYTEKDFLSPLGYIILNKKRHDLTPLDIGVFDDHRGYYPINSGYDWLACMGDVFYQNRLLKISLNLTDFLCSGDQNIHSENGYFMNNTYSHLPKVTFTRNGDIWKISDESGRVDLTFERTNDSKFIKKHIFKVDYMLAIGKLNGTLTLITGVTINIKDMFAVGEKRRTSFLKNI